jgi:hypothetical protein
MKLRSLFALVALGSRSDAHDSQTLWLALGIHVADPSVITRRAW